MVWGSSELLPFEKDLLRQLKDDEIMIGEKTPMRYAFSILCLLKKKGIVKVYVNKKKTFECRYTHITKSIKDRWQEVLRFLNYADVKVIDNNESEYFEVITLAW